MTRCTVEHLISTR